MAVPCPPPMHAEPTPKRPSRRCSSWVRCAVMRAPEAPSGCPSAIAPPLLLVIARSRPSSFSQARYWAAKASLISTRVMSASVRLARRSASLIAGTGPMPITLGSTPTLAYDTTRARGVSPCSATAASLATTSAPAPSLMPDALPAVTVPPFLNTGFSFASVSAVVPGRGPSSLSSVSTPRLPLNSTGAISAANTPASCASAHAACDLAAYASQSSRVMPCRSARFSAVMPIGRLTNESVSADHSTSCSCRPAPRGVPQRACCPYAASGACDMDSVPPHSATLASPSLMASTPLMTAWKPEPQRRFNVSAGTSIGTPARKAA
mmetsp:Transcript_16556/g.52805  ORF Transcript_16556/g.52805 Transcript_16556/m.52805 type:complete len:322 (+) Transcript_16556:61-1026(+)